MELTVNNLNNEYKRNYKQAGNKNNYAPTFKGPLDGMVTGVLRTLDTNEMANAVILDLGTMVAPRTYFDTKDRNKYAGGETFIREICGTVINCLAAGFLGGVIAKVAAKHIDKDVSVNPKSWFSEDAVDVLESAWDMSDNQSDLYVKNVFNGIKAKDGAKDVSFKTIDWGNVNWFEENKWQKFVWDNPKYENIESRLKTETGFVDVLNEVILDKDITPKDKKQVFGIFETRLTNALKANRDIEVNVGTGKLNTNLHNLLRDTYDMAKDVFTNSAVDTKAALRKIKAVNNVKIFGALSLASAMGISVQKLNRKLTEKRTGKKGFVGEVDYTGKNTKANENKKGLLAKKLIASAGMVAMVMGVMKVKNPKDFVKKLQFTGPVSTGNAIKTVYMSTIVGRFLAADSNNELRESVVRDYFGFLNWLVLGGFAAKAVGNLLDPARQNLFNIKKEGKGLKHWLNDISLKTHEEIAAHGSEFAKKNIRKLNIAHLAGLGYSTLMLGVILPKINTKMTQKYSKNESAKKS